MVVIVQFREGKIACERIYWDQATVLRQVGLLNDVSRYAARSLRESRCSIDAKSFRTSLPGVTVRMILFLLCLTESATRSASPELHKKPGRLLANRLSPC